jgi:hypothetical protein
MKRIRLIVLLLLTIAPHSQSDSPTAVTKATSPDPNLILQSLERTEQDNPARVHPYQVIRRYKVFAADSKQPVAEITAQISFTPPNTKTFKIMQASGNPRGEKMVRSILDQEVESARDGRDTDISRMNYDFVFLREENFGLSPEYVFHIVPKFKRRGLLLGQIWVDAKTFRIRRIEAVPVKSPSMWIKDIHITLQFAEVNQMWLPVSLDAIAMVRLLGHYTLTGVNISEAWAQ